MKRWFETKDFVGNGTVIALGLAVSLALLQFAAPQQPAAAVEETVARSVVEITDGASLGSGVVIDQARGLILTNAHVSDRLDNDLVIAFSDGCKVKARVLWISTKTDDLSLVQVRTDQGRRPEGVNQDCTVPEAVAIRRSPLAVGEDVFAVGNPFGLERSITWGRVSVVDRRIGAIPSHVQVDIWIGPGSSGGGLFDRTGNLVGITDSGLSVFGIPLGFNFAIPVDTICTLLVCDRR